MAGDALDDLLDFDVNQNDVFRDVDTNMDVPSRRKGLSPSAGVSNGITGIGIDEEIQVKKKRKPIPKLDESRLLSQAGIPKLRRIAKERLRFKGKGHEYSDVARLLSVYQLWLDALYPRAKFADGLAIIEKLGHTKRMQTMRREWINEGKPRDQSEKVLRQPRELATQKQNSLEPQESVSNNLERSKTPLANDFDDEDLYTATPRKSNHKTDLAPKESVTESLFLSENEAASQPSEDDLDALIAEDEQNQMSLGSENRSHPAPEGRTQKLDAGYEDEMEAMADIDDMW
ncbi:chromosome segregation in meiosis- protein [Pseudocyphellaria aurata]|nr:chromosome segregation in meiosis- protein [Pseudocyphellaria aurata]